MSSSKNFSVAGWNPSNISNFKISAQEFIIRIGKKVGSGLTIDIFSFPLISFIYPHKIKKPNPFIERCMMQDT
jgi:hypothetical protein